MYNFTPDLSAAIKEGVYRVYFKPHVRPTYNAVLWTMSIELFGSLFVFALLALCGRMSRRWAVYGALAVLMWINFRQYFDFLAGVALCDLWVRFGDRRRLGFGSGAVLLFVGLVFGTPIVKPGEDQTPLMDGYTLGAVLILAAVLFTPALRRVLDHSLLAWLGRVSFALYLVHTPLLASLGCGTWIALHDLGWSYNMAALGTASVSIVASLASAWAFTIVFDRPAVKLARFIGKQVVSARSSSSAAR
jgi:peptidoglycan/LPS O-acetylase OafA/YrhL